MEDAHEKKKSDDEKAECSAHLSDNDAQRGGPIQAASAELTDPYANETLSDGSGDEAENLDIGTDEETVNGSTDEEENIEIEAEDEFDSADDGEEEALDIDSETEDAMMESGDSGVPGSGLFPCGARPVPVMKRPPGAAPVFPSSPCRAVPAQGEVMNIIAIIPARMGSSRFPGKPLALIHGVPMVGHVAFRTAMSRCLSATYVATCDTVIEDYCKEAGLACVMTGDHHVRCSTRTAEALLKIEAATGRKADIVVMVQGDEPMVLPGMIDAAVEPMLKDPTINVVNLMADMDTLEEFEDPNEVKVVVDRNSDALYFSREPIPSRKKGADKVPMRKQVCIIPFRRDYLIRFNEMEESPLEICESVDMMRILEHGEKVRMVPTDARTWSVDTPEDLARVTRLMEGDALMREYAK